jgi:hypothetical protein
MTTVYKVKRFRNWRFTAAEWQAANPVLLDGELGIEKGQSGRLDRYKVGDEVTPWNDLPYAEDIYIAPGDELDGLPVAEVLRQMRNPYQVPVITSLTNKADGSLKSNQFLEVGTLVSSPLEIRWTITNPANLGDQDGVIVNPLTINGQGLFSNEGAIANTGVHQLAFKTAYAPSSPVTLTVTLSGTHKKGALASRSTTVKYSHRIYWGVSSSPTLSSLSGLAFKQDGVVTGTYIFTGPGFHYLLVPTSISLAGLTFWDPDTGFQFAISDTGQTITRTNGSVSYQLRILRSTFALSEATRLEVRNV